MTTTDWRGRLDEKSDDDTPIDETLSRRREARSLLVSLLRPFQRDGRAAGRCRGGGKPCPPVGSAVWCSAASTTASRPSWPAVRHANSW